VLNGNREAADFASPTPLHGRWVSSVSDSVCLKIKVSCEAQQTHRIKVIGSADGPEGS
jgi:hypothetical protein